MILSMLAAAAAAALQPKTLFTVDPKHALVEGVASDGRTIWVSSVLDRTILACRKSCRALTVLPSGLHPLGIAWDAKRKRLWIAADCPKLPGVPSCERGTLLAIDSAGKLRTRISPFVGQFHPGDVSASNGQVFVSDSGNGMVFRLVSSDRAIMAVVLPGVGKSAQGTALDPTGMRLVIADYSQGIGIADIAKFQRTLLPRQDGKPLRGIDGLVRCGNRYFGIYNGASPGRLIAFTIGKDSLHFEEPVAGLTLPDPTQIAYDGKRLLIVPNAGWGPASNALAEPRSPAPIIAIPLSKDCKPI